MAQIDQFGRSPLSERQALLAFSLDEELSGGADATADATALTWSPSSGKYVEDTNAETITVIAGRPNCYGIAGEVGMAAQVPVTGSDPVAWVVVDNPGRPLYVGTLDADLNAGSSAAVSVDTATVTIYDTYNAIDSGYKIASGGTVVFIYDPDEEEFALIDAFACEVAQ